MDTVPFGGAYDGAYGVVGALAAAKALKESGLHLPRPLRVAAFTDEEGPRFGSGLFGSKAITGTLDMEHLRHAQDDQKLPLKDAMAQYGCNLEKLPAVSQSRSGFWGYLELHIEQGPRLERQQIPIATVTAITGIRQISLSFIGKANHAGTTPKAERQNALRAAAETIAHFSAYVDHRENLVANPGHIEVHPNAANVVPGEARLHWDIRSPNPALLDEAYSRLLAMAKEAGRPFQVAVEGKIFHDVPPSPLHRPWLTVIEAAAARCQLACTRLVSWAGHDAGVLGMVLPAAMIFVPSHQGLSHAPDELTADTDLLNGVAVLTETARQLLAEEVSS